MVGVQNWNGLSGRIGRVWRTLGPTAGSTAWGLHAALVEQVGGQRCRRWLVLHVAPQACAAQAAGELALGVGEAVLGRIVGPFQERLDLPFGVGRQRMADELVQVGCDRATGARSVRAWLARVCKRCWPVCTVARRGRTCPITRGKTPDWTACPSTASKICTRRHGWSIWYGTRWTTSPST